MSEEKIFKFRIILDTEEDVIRDIEIQDDCSFINLHECIQQSFGFSGVEMASFYRSDELWEKGEELPLIDMGGAENDAPGLAMNDLVLKEHIKEKHERFLYVYDFLRMWCFYVEVIELSEAKPELDYPLISFELGKAPSEDSKEVDLFDDIDLGDLAGDSKAEKTGDPEIDAYLDEMDGDDDYEDLGMENLDDYQDLF